MNLPLPTQLTLTSPTFLIPPYTNPTHTLNIYNSLTNQLIFTKLILKEFYGEEFSNHYAENNYPFPTHHNCKKLGKRG